MSRSPDSGQLDLADVFLRVQAKLLADLTIGGIFEHPSANGTASERLWLDLFAQYLPKRYRAAPAFIINSRGHRSRQIDIAIFDNVNSTPLFPHTSGDHIPIESVYAVFEVKPTISKQWLEDAEEKAASVRKLRHNNRKILAGILATSSVWQPATFCANVRRLVRRSLGEGGLDFGCALEHGAFERTSTVRVSSPNRALIFFLLRLITRLNHQRPAPKPNLLTYLR